VSVPVAPGGIWRVELWLSTREAAIVFAGGEKLFKRGAVAAPPAPVPEFGADGVGDAVAIELNALPPLGGANSGPAETPVPLREDGEPPATGAAGGTTTPFGTAATCPSARPTM
jgi:hypothetical protein